MEEDLPVGSGQHLSVEALKGHLRDASAIGNPILQLIMQTFDKLSRTRSCDFSGNITPFNIADIVYFANRAKIDDCQLDNFVSLIMQLDCHQRNSFAKKNEANKAPRGKM